MPTELTEMEYDEVSLVDSGANQHAHVTLYKRDEGDGVVKDEEVEDIEVSAEDLDALGDEVADVLGNLPDEEDVEKHGDPSRLGYAAKHPNSRNGVARRQDAVVTAALPAAKKVLRARKKKDHASRSKSGSAALEAFRDRMSKNLTPGDVHADAVIGKQCGHKMGTGKCDRCKKKKSSAVYKVAEAVAKQDSNALWNAVLEFQNELEGVEKSWEDDDTPRNSEEVTDFLVLTDTLAINKADTKGAPMPLNKEDLAPDVLEYVNGLEAIIEEMTAEEDVAKSDLPEDIFKGLDPRVREVIEKAQKTAEDATTELAKREDERLTKEFIEKASTFKNLPVNAAEFGPVLKSLATANPEAFAEVERVLRAADAGSKTGEVFKQAGSDQGGTASAKEQVDVMAQEILKSDTSLTIAQARAQVYRTNPSLYDQTLGGE